MIIVSQSYALTGNPIAKTFTKMSRLPPVLNVTLNVQLDVEIFLITTVASSPMLDDDPETMVAVITGFPLNGG